MKCLQVLSSFYVRVGTYKQISPCPPFRLQKRPPTPPLHPLTHPHFCSVPPCRAGSWPWTCTAASARIAPAAPRCYVAAPWPARYARCSSAAWSLSHPLPSWRLQPPPGTQCCLPGFTGFAGRGSSPSCPSLGRYGGSIAALRKAAGGAAVITMKAAGAVEALCRPHNLGVVCVQFSLPPEWR